MGSRIGTNERSALHESVEVNGALAEGMARSAKYSLGRVGQGRMLGNRLRPARSRQNPIAIDRSSELPRDALRRQIVILYLANVDLGGKAAPAVITPDQPQKKASSGLTIESDWVSLAVLGANAGRASADASLCEIRCA